MKHLAVFFVVLLGIRLCGADTTEEVAKKIQSLQQVIAEKQQQYQKEQQKNQERLKRIELARSRQDQEQLNKELPLAYQAAEKLDRMNAEIHSLLDQKKRMCLDWNQAYRKTIDELLEEMNRESRKVDSALAQKIQRYYQLHLEICPEDRKAAGTPDWRSLKIEPYDGPQEIQQKIQLLCDISRELKLQRARLETQYLDLLRERRVRERAVEFLQDRTLFNDPVNVRPPSSAVSSTPLGSENVGSAREDQPHQAAGELADPRWSLEWPSSNPQQQDAHYRKIQEDLSLQERELQRKINEFKKQVENLLQK